MITVTGSIKIYALYLWYDVVIDETKDSNNKKGSKDDNASEKTIALFLIRSLSGHGFISMLTHRKKTDKNGKKWCHHCIVKRITRV